MSISGEKMLGTIQAYRYNCIDLDTLESLIYRMKILSIIDKNKLSFQLKEIILHDMGIEDDESWISDILPSMLLVNIIDTIDLDSKTLLMDSIYYSCFTDFKLFEKADNNGLILDGSLRYEGEQLTSKVMSTDRVLRLGTHLGKMQENL